MASQTEITTMRWLILVAVLMALPAGAGMRIGSVYCCH
jgi:hypothetical protein